jgi:hypothetical protein
MIILSSYYFIVLGACRFSKVFHDTLKYLVIMMILRLEGGKLYQTLYCAHNYLSVFLWPLDGL